MHDCLSTLSADTLQPLAQIRARTSLPLVHSLLAVADSAVAVDNWIDSLECLYLGDDTHDHGPDGHFLPPSKRRKGADGRLLKKSDASIKTLKRRTLDPLSASDAARNYVAVSYTWDPSPDEHQAIGAYVVEARRRQPRPLKSHVRDIVWDRVLRFAKHVGCPNIWIDRECIDQDNDVEKQAAMQSMHLVYSLSRFPVAILTCKISSQRQLALLGNLVKGKVPETDQDDTLGLLQYITSSPWWNRAWTFQEDYRASARIKLLIPHAPDLEAQKRKVRTARGASLFGAIIGELTLKSVDFKRQTTRFCLAYQKKRGLDPVCRKILEAAGRYTELLRAEATVPGRPSITRSMSPTIFADVGKRGIRTESDRLAIIANCCGYDTRISTLTLGAAPGNQGSLSLSFLALFLLNGEIMENDSAHNSSSLEDTIYTYLSKQSLQSFRPVVHEELSFIKHCRFIRPRLTAEGIVTEGHLWRLGRVIRRQEALKDPDLSTSQILQILSCELKDGTFGEDYTELGEHIDEWISDSSQAPSASLSSQHPSSQWREWMASQVAQCLRDGNPLRLGTLVDDGKLGKTHPAKPAPRPPTAIFVGDDEKDWNQEQKTSPSRCGGAVLGQDKHIFTSLRWARDDTLDEIDKHVSLEVRIDHHGKRDTDDEPVGVHVPGRTRTRRGGRTQAVATPPRLIIDRWVNGLCFFAGRPKQEVVFPLPSALTQ